MKLNEINKELQTWFKIESYEDVEKLSLREFHKEFQVRKNIFEGMDFFDGDDQIFKRILAGEPLVSSVFDMKDLSNHSNSHIQQVTPPSVRIDVTPIKNSNGAVGKHHETHFARTKISSTG